MNYTCPLCSIDASNHSLTKLKEINNTIYYYSCPSQAKLYFDYQGITNHYHGELSLIPENKKWIWICDSKDFGFNHFIQIKVAIELAKLISSKFSTNLLQIIIINPTIYISSSYNIIKPFLSEKVNEIILFNYESKTIDDIFLGLENNGF